MTTLSSRLAATAIASLFLMGTAFAQTPAPAPTATHPPAAATTMAKKPRSAASMECSKEADAKGLHGKARKKFRKDCVRAKKTNADDAAKSAK
ncbi:MAG TPA: PsiF family protein [Bradyrhizobium sp.]|nr:PsiF family protein [Bradyrhizobium sp.]